MSQRRLILFLLLVTSFASATYSQAGYDSLIFTSASRFQKISFIDSTIQFTPAEAKQFWPIYDQYMDKWEKLMSDRIDLIQENNETPELECRKNKEFIRRLYSNDLALTRLQKKYYSRFRKVLPPPKANQFMQIEYETQNRIRVMEQGIRYL